MSVIAPTSTDLLPVGGSLEGSSRVTQASVSALFPGRWSPRGFSERSVDDGIVNSLFEAARWAPSCFNGQPWHFLVATTTDELELFRPLLLDGNRVWADRAPVLAFVLGKRAFRHDGNPNRFRGFDAGAAWMSVALQAHIHGLATHAMGGIRVEDVYETLGVDPDEWEVLCGLAIGWPDPDAPLAAWAAEIEAPNARLPLGEIVTRGPMSQA